MRNMTIRQAERLAQRWLNDEITATTYQFNQARQALNLYRDELSAENHSALAGLVEFYYHHQ